MEINKRNKKEKSEDPIGESLGIESSIVSAEVVSEVSITESTQKSKEEIDQIQKDYEYSRGNLYSLVEKGQEAINGILELAQESDSPRAYEVAGQLIKSVADTTDKLIDLQKKMKDLYDTQPKGPTNVTNALFVGSTTELSKILKGQEQKHK
jgi:hypothetical protein